jgi:hypothetical protein
MHKLPAVEEARAVMTEGMKWGVFKWLTEKRRVRRIADAATAALDEADDQTKATWPESLKKAYREAELSFEVDGNPKAKKLFEKAVAEAQDVPAKVKVLARSVKEADDIAYDARMDAEDLFAEAERKLSVSLTKQGAQRALDTYDLREKAIRKAESARKTVLTEE